MARMKESDRLELVAKTKKSVLRTLERLPLEEDPECINIYSPIPFWLAECYSTRVIYNIFNCASWEFIQEKNELANKLCMNALRSIEEEVNRSKKKKAI